MSRNSRFDKVWMAIKNMLAISHGQGTVECGLSVNKELEVKNLQEYSVTAQILICGHVDRVGAIVNITTPLLTTKVHGLSGLSKMTRVLENFLL